MSKLIKLPTRKEVPETRRPVHSVPANDLISAGKRLRDTVPRASHGEWKRHKVECAPIAGQDQAAVLTVGGAC